MASPVKFTAKGSAPFSASASSKTRAAKGGGVRAKGTPGTGKGGGNIGSADGGSGRTAHYNKSHIPD